jgi:hypothetical protein
MVRIKEVAGDTGVTYPHPSSRRRRPQPAVPAESGFVLILVLPVAMLLMMTALSLVFRSNSAAVASADESRAQAARMAAEFGLNQVMARINTEYNCTNSIPLSTSNTDIGGSSPPASYTITSPLNLCGSVVAPCTTNPPTDLPVTIRGILTVDSSTTYTHEINRTLSVCEPVANSLRVRGVR